MTQKTAIYKIESIQLPFKFAKIITEEKPP